MIVVCTGCSAKFRVADEKVGPRGARLRCSRCQTVFLVRRDEAEGAPAAADPGIPAPAAPPTPPPVVARPAPPAPPPRVAAPSQALDPFAVIAGLDRLAYHPAQPVGTPAPGKFELELDPPPSPPADPFEAPAHAQVDPFAALSPAAADPFATAAPPGEDPFGGPSAAAGAPPPQPADLAFDAIPGAAHLSLEEQTAPPRKARPVSVGVEEDAGLGMPGMSDVMDDPFASPRPPAPPEPPPAASEEGSGDLSLPGLESGLSPVLPPPPEPPATEAAGPLQVDPFAAAAVKAPLLAEERAAEPDGPAEAPPDGTAERRLAGVSTLRDLAVNAVSLVALLVLALGIWLGWRGGLSPRDALRPATIVAALRPQPRSGPLVTGNVRSGFYERERGAPVAFVRGTIASTSTSPLEGVKVTVELVRDGRVLARGEVPAGVVLGPETLFGVADGPALARAAAEAAGGAPGRLLPGEEAPFLVAFLDDPAALAGATVRISASAGNGP